METRGAGPGALIERVRESQAEEMSGRCVGALRWKVVQEVSREVSRTCLGHVQEVSTSAHLPSPTRLDPWRMRAAPLALRWRGSSNLRFSSIL